MAKWFRSEEMEYVSLIVNEDAAHGAVNDLGMLGIIQFTDVRTWGGKGREAFFVIGQTTEWMYAMPCGV